MKKILSLSYDDYANLSHDHTRAMRSAGLDAQSMKLKPHTFAYAEQAQVVSVEMMGEAIRKADIIIIYHSSLHILSIVQKFVDKSDKTVDLIGFHTGTTYREDPRGIRQAFEAMGVHRHLTDQCEFLLPDFGKDLIYLAAAIDIRAIRAQGTFPSVGSMYQIAHYPSKAEVKGTSRIRELIDQYGGKFHFTCSVEHVPHSEQIRRMSKCDIYLELFQNMLGGQPYGCYGVSAFEAAALGRIVMTQNINPGAYRATYGIDTPFLLCNSEQEFESHLTWLSSLNPHTIQVLQQRTYEWMNQYHSLEATGHRLSGILLK